MQSLKINRQKSEEEDKIGGGGGVPSTQHNENTK